MLNIEIVFSALQLPVIKDNQTWEKEKNAIHVT